MSRGAHSRCVIALDLDNFYVACERLRDPSLIGKPVGIKQKGILATCSYEARAKGVGKLMPVGKACRLCPDLVLVSGEDLTLYRHHSREVFALVRKLCGPETAVEKLGMDELFVDVSSLVQRGVSDGERLEMGSGQESVSIGTGWDGWVVGGSEDGAAEIEEEPEELRIASFVAGHLRKRIFSDLGLTTSAGISANKLMSKLLASHHKPFDQTSLCLRFPPSPAAQLRLQSILDPLDLRSLPGYGSSVVSKLISILPPHPPPSESLSATHLHSLLSGLDSSPIKLSPDFPAQIGVEDSYASDSRMDQARFSREIRRLTASLLRRLELELVQDGAWVRWPQRVTLGLRKTWDVPSGRVEKGAGLPAWVFERSVDVGERVERLVGGAKQTGVLGRLMRDLEKRDAFDLYVINVSVSGLSSTLPNSTLDDAWSRATSAGASSASAARSWPFLDQDDLDLEVLASLPDSLRSEVLASYGLSALPSTSSLHPPTSPRPKKRSASPAPAQLSIKRSKSIEVIDLDHEGAVGSRHVASADEEGGEVDQEILKRWAEDDTYGSWSSEEENAGDEDDGRVRCGICEAWVMRFAEGAHRLFHEQAG